MAENYPIYFRNADFAKLNETINPKFVEFKVSDSSLAEDITNMLNTVPHEPLTSMRINVAQIIFNSINMMLAMSNCYITKEKFGEIAIEGQRQRRSKTLKNKTNILIPSHNNIHFHTLNLNKLDSLLQTKFVVNNNESFCDNDISSTYAYVAAMDYDAKNKLRDRRVAYVDEQIYKDARVNSFIEALKDSKTIVTALEDYYSYVHVGFYNVYIHKAGDSLDEYDTLAKLMLAIAAELEEHAIVSMALHNLKVLMEDAAFNNIDAIDTNNEDQMKSIKLN